MPRHRIVWFDLPVRDLGRAMVFCRAVPDVAIEEAYAGVGVIESESGDVSGCLYVDEERVGSDGPLLYFNVDGRLSTAVAAVAAGGGLVEEPPQSIGEHGIRTVVRDIDGNRIALHAASDD
ncbi:MAG: VOC family protein [Bacteroidota bacterium]